MNAKLQLKRPFRIPRCRWDGS